VHYFFERRHTLQHVDRGVAPPEFLSGVSALTKGRPPVSLLRG